MSLKSNIRQVLGLLEKVIQQTPLDKQPFLMHKVTKVNEKYMNLNNQQNEPSYLKELQFNLNFIRLSFPHLDYSPPNESPQQSTEGEANQNEVNSARANSEFFQLQNKQKVQKFMEETAKVLVGVREEVEFSNWGTGNLDPQDLKRHKELLKRQYFGGQFWKGKEKPINPTAAYLMNVMTNEPEMKDETVSVEQKEEDKSVGSQSSNNWQKVKR